MRRVRAKALRAQAERETVGKSKAETTTWYRRLKKRYIRNG